MGKRGELQEGDKELARQREQMSWESLNSSLPGVTTHSLHPEHPLSLEEACCESVCYACHNSIPDGTLRYTCGTCESFNVHPACLKNWWEDCPSILQTFAHNHPVCSKMGDSSASDQFHCSHCKDDENSTSGMYQCQDESCLKQFHLICGNNPTMVRSFLHPNHILDLKPRHHFKKCAVCNHGGKTNMRVYTCEACDFFVHPRCASIDQYWMNHTLHRPLASSTSVEEHVLVYRELHVNQKPVCGACQRECKGWSYTCYSCIGVHFHRNCLLNGTGDHGSLWDKFAQGAIDGCAKMVGEKAGEKLGELLYEGVTIAVTAAVTTAAALL